LIIAWSSASSMSAIFRTRTSSTIYNNYVEMREVLGQEGRWILTASEKAWRVWVGTKIKSFIAGIMLLLRNLQEFFGVHRAWHSPSTLPNMIHGRAFHIITWQPPIPRALPIHKIPK
jgi:hypothetical protein